jgi:hypothetical protein
MQRTRLNTLVNVAGGQLTLLFSNPWRRIALSTIALLFGFFMGSAIATTAGQDATWDICAAGILFLLTELISKLVYRRRTLSLLAATPQRRSLWVDVLNLFKMGLTYNLFLEAFKLGS